MRHNLWALQVYGVEWNPHQTEGMVPAFITFGRKHIKMWTSEDPKGNSGWKAKQLSFGKLPMQVGRGTVFFCSTWEPCCFT